MIVADSSSLISIALNCISGVFAELGTQITVTPAVYGEVVTRPASSRKYALESLRIKRLFNQGVIKSVKANKVTTDRIMDLANSVFEVKGKTLKIIHLGEAEALALVKDLDADALLIDERTTRLVIEDPKALSGFLAYRAKSKVRINQNRLDELAAYVPKVPVIRSTEIAAVAYDRGVLEDMLDSKGKKVLDATLSALKYSGCSVSWEEIDEYMRMVN